jgi:hypothetical protein
MKTRILFVYTMISLIGCGTPKKITTSPKRIHFDGAIFLVLQLQLDYY